MLFVTMGNIIKNTNNAYAMKDGMTPRLEVIIKHL